MPKAFPNEFRDDVIRVAESRDTEFTLAQIAKDFGVHIGTLDKVDTSNADRDWRAARRDEVGVRGAS